MTRDQALPGRNFCRLYGPLLAFGLLVCGRGVAQVEPYAVETALPDAPSFLQQAAAPQPHGTGSIYGLLSDVNGGIVPGATVSILDSAGQPTRETTSDSGGQFRLAGLPAGTYKLKIQAPGLQTFQPPEVTLKDGEQFELPPTALPIATANQSFDVVMTREQIADQELKDETKQRVLGILPNFYTSYVWDAAPLNSRQKFKLTLRALVDPFVFVRTGIIAGIQEADGTFPEYGDGFSGYAERYGAAYGDVVAGRMIGSAILPSIFHQDPRYFYRGTGGVPRRALHALISSVAARSDSRKHVEPNYTRTIGDFAAGYLSRTWHPGSDNGITLAVDNMLLGIADAAGRNLLQEFLFKHISRGTPPLAKGKPPEEKEAAAHP